MKEKKNQEKNLVFSNLVFLTWMDQISLYLTQVHIRTEFLSKVAAFLFSPCDFTNFDESLGQLKQEVTKELQNELQLINDWMTNLPQYQQYVDGLYMGKKDLFTLENIPKEFLNFHNLAIPQ